MAIGARSALLVAMLAVSGAPAWAQIAVLPLVGEDDPVWLSDAAFDATDAPRQAITMRLENTTAFPISTDQIWLSVSRFYTPDETRRNGNRIVWDCGLGARANLDQPAQVIQPGASVPIRLPLKQACDLNPEHDHFFVTVQRLSAGQRFADATWQRDPADHTRLLQAAMLIAK